MRILALMAVSFVLTACQSPSPVASSTRSPAAAPGATSWQELVTDDPATFLNVRETQTRIALLNWKIQTLKDCGVSERPWTESLLELDLLYIRAKSWPDARFEKEYGRKMSPQQMRCLQTQASAAAGV